MALEVYPGWEVIHIVGTPYGTTFGFGDVARALSSDGGGIISRYAEVRGTSIESASRLNTEDTVYLEYKKGVLKNGRKGYCRVIFEDPEVDPTVWPSVADFIEYIEKNWESLVAHAVEQADLKL